MKISRALFIGLFLVIIILGPLLQPGYIFALDMVFSPYYPLPTIISSDYIYRYVIHGASSIVSTMIVQKAIMIGVILLAVLSLKSLLAIILRFHKSYLPMLISFMIYIFNPFVYSRFMSGQYFILLGYALLPLVIARTLILMRDPSWKNTLYNLLSFLVLALISLHIFGIALLACIPLVVLFTYLKRNDIEYIRSLLTKLTYSVFVFIFLNLYWIIPSILGNSSTSKIIDSFDKSDFTAFATHAQESGTLGNVLTMHGFWADIADLYIIPQDIYSWWWIPIVMLWILVGIGFYRGWRTMKGLSIAFAAMFVTAVILATGTSGSIFAPINEWLVANVPFFAGYREPQKFVAIIVLVYAIFGALGVEQIIQWLRGRKLANWYINTIAASLLIIPIATAPLMLWGFGGQLKTSEYPREWYAMNTYLEEAVPKDTKILALPWHLYMRFDFAGRVIANPMDKFFTPELVISNDPEFNGAKAYTSTDAQTKLDSAILAEAPNRTDLGKQLADLDIEYILVAKEFDYEKYNYLDKQIDLELVREDASLKLYKVKTSGN